MLKNIEKITAFAPASCANVVLGFDCLGFAIEGVGDKVTLKLRGDEKLIIQHINHPKIPSENHKNVVTVSIEAMRKALNIQQGFDIKIEKGIPLSSGMGGSAASTVAAVVALNAFLEKPLSNNQLIEFALKGEELASQARHADNIAPSLLGGFQLCYSNEPFAALALPDADLSALIVHPDYELETAKSRSVLPKTISLKQHTDQLAHFGALIEILHTQQHEKLRSIMTDKIIEPHRKTLIPCFDEIQAAAYENSALACSISGAGPSIFALFADKQLATDTAPKLVEIFEKKDIKADTWVTGLKTRGAYILD